MFLKIIMQEVSKQAVNQSFYFRIPQFCFCLPFKLRLRNFQGNYSSQSLSCISASQRNISHFMFLDIIIYNSSQCSAKAGIMSSMLNSINVIYKAKNIFIVIIGNKLQGNLNNNIIFFFIKINYIANFFFCLIQIFNKTFYSSFILVNYFFTFIFIS